MKNIQADDSTITLTARTARDQPYFHKPHVVIDDPTAVTAVVAEPQAQVTSNSGMVTQHVINKVRDTLNAEFFQGGEDFVPVTVKSGKERDQWVLGGFEGEGRSVKDALPIIVKSLREQKVNLPADIETSLPKLTDSAGWKGFSRSSTPQPRAKPQHAWRAGLVTLPFDAGLGSFTVDVDEGRMAFRGVEENMKPQVEAVFRKVPHEKEIQVATKEEEEAGKYRIEVSGFMPREMESVVAATIDGLHKSNVLVAYEQNASVIQTFLAAVREAIEANTLDHTGGDRPLPARRL